MQSQTLTASNGEFSEGLERKKLPENITEMLLLLFGRTRIFPGFCDVAPTCQLFHVFCTTQF